MKLITKTYAILMLMISINAIAQKPAQTTYIISSSKEVAMKLLGTSTLHNWDMDAQMLTGEAQFNIAGSTIKMINSLSFSLPVENLKSDSKSMDNNAYEALKSDKYANIVFKLTSASVRPQTDNKHAIRAVGNLSIAGVTKEITMDVYCQVNTDNTITCSGTEKLKMTDYQVKPPTFLFGAMKTGDEITLDFNLIFKSKSVTTLTPNLN